MTGACAPEVATLGLTGTQCRMPALARETMGSARRGGRCDSPPAARRTARRTPRGDIGARPRRQNQRPHRQDEGAVCASNDRPLLRTGRRPPPRGAQDRCPPLAPRPPAGFQGLRLTSAHPHAPGRLTCCSMPFSMGAGRAPRASEKPQRVVSSGLRSSARHCRTRPPARKRARGDRAVHGSPCSVRTGGRAGTHTRTPQPGVGATHRAPRAPPAPAPARRTRCRGRPALTRPPPATERA